MKKIIILILLISSFAYSQDFDLTANQTNGKFSLATNNTTFMGIASGNVVIPNFFDASGTIDTSAWGLTANQTNGKYSIAYNKTTFMGKDSGTVVIPVYFGSNSSSSSVDTSLIPFLNQNNTLTGAINTFTGKMVVGTGTSNGTADLLVMGDTTTLRGTTLRDSSYLRVLVNPFSNRLKIEAIGKTGTNMLTVDSTFITSALAMTITGDFTTGGNIFAGSNSKYIGWSTRSVLQSTADGTIDFFFNNGTTRATIDAGILRGRTTTPIATASTTGVAGTIIVGSDNYIYICTATNTWVRVLGLTW